MLQFLLAHYIDILMISESKIIGTFTSLQFQICGFRTIYRLDRNNRGGGIILFISKNLITSFLLRQPFPYDIEILLIELNHRKKKWLICCCYNLCKNLINYHLQDANLLENHKTTKFTNHLQELTEVIQTSFNNGILWMGDFNCGFWNQFFYFLWVLWSKKYYQPVDQLQKPYKSIMHRPVPNKLTKQL